MPLSTSALKLLAEKLAAKAPPLVSENLSNLARAVTQSASGSLLSRSFNPEELTALDKAVTLMRRKSLSDLAGPESRLLNVHEANKTGAQSGIAASKKARLEQEPEMFTKSGQTYGYLTSDPFGLVDQPLMRHAPIRGSRFSASGPVQMPSFLAPESALPQYGQYAIELRPEMKSYTTMTLDDSLDRTRGSFATANALLKGQSGPFLDIGIPNSKLWNMAQEYLSNWQTIADELAASGVTPHLIPKKVPEILKSKGLPSSFSDMLNANGLEGLQHNTRLPRQIPRVLDDLQNPALLPSEIYSLEDVQNLQNTLAQHNPAEYIEAQIHAPVTPDSIARIYDLNYKPSLSTEKLVKSLGIEYVPRPMTGIYDKIKGQNLANMGEFIDASNQLGTPVPYTDSLLRDPSLLNDSEKAYRNLPMPPFKRGYAGGGLVTSLAKALEWAKAAEAASGVPNTSKFFYDASKAMNAGKALALSAEETDRLTRAVKQGFNAVGYRYTQNLAKDQTHLDKIASKNPRLTGEQQSYHVDLTPGAQGARSRGYNVEHDVNALYDTENIHPLALKLQQVEKATDEQANQRRFIQQALDRGASGIVYSPVEGELYPGREAIDAFAQSIEQRSPGLYQPSIAVIDPSTVRHLNDAKFEDEGVGLFKAKGGTVQDPDQMTHKKFVPAANPLVQIPRGWLAGTAGLGRDAEDLTRLVAKYFSAPGSIAERYGQGEAVLPSTEFYKEWLPGKDDGLGAGELNSLGSLASGVGLGTAAKGVTRVGSAIAHAAPGPLAGGRAAQQGVIKLKGLSGNWLKGSAEDALAGLKKGEPPAITSQPDVARALGLSETELSSQRAWRQGHGTIMTPAGERDLQEALSSINPPRPPDPLNSWIDKQLTGYVKSDMATPTDPVRLAIEAWPEKKKGLQELAQAKLDFLNAKTERLMNERGVPAEFLTRHRQEVLAAEKAKKQLDLQEGMHMSLPQGGNWTPEYLENTRTVAGFPAEGFGKGELSKYWEDLADVGVAPPMRAGALVRQSERTLSPSAQTLSENPWLVKVPPETAVYDAHSDISTELGFNHLMDELRNATSSHGQQQELNAWLKKAKTPDEVTAARQAFTPNLPAELQIDPASLSKLTVPQAVEHVAKINAWRAAQQFEADAVRANNAAVVTHKEYPHSPETPNPKGMKWVEFKQPEAVLEEGHAPGPVSGYPDMHGIIDQRTGQSVSLGATPEEALRLYQREGRTKQLQAALKYEGDVMQHCVGGEGYCNNILEGKGRILSLRDAEHRPHATVEVVPGRLITESDLPQDVLDKIAAETKGKSWAEYDKAVAGEIEKIRRTESIPESILQIKGVLNGAPEAEYLPYIQDLVKSGKWSDVGDLQNTGLQKADWAPETLKQLQDFGIHAPDYGTADEINAAINALNKAKGFSHGGSVYSPQRVDEIIAQHRNSEYDPARVDALVAQLKEELYA